MIAGHPCRVWFPTLLSASHTEEEIAILCSVLYSWAAQTGTRWPGSWQCSIHCVRPLTWSVLTCFRTLPGKYLEDIATQMRAHSINALLIIGGFEVRPTRAYPLAPWCCRLQRWPVPAPPGSSGIGVIDSSPTCHWTTVTHSIAGGMTRPAGSDT